MAGRGTPGARGHLHLPGPIPSPNLSLVNTALLRRLLPVLCLALATGLHAATEPAATPAAPAAKEAAKPAEPAAKSAADAPAPDAKPVELPKFEVLGASRVHAIDVELKKLDKLIAREKKSVHSTELDRAFNNTEVSKAATIFGGNSADHLAAVAATRVSLMESERDVLEAMKRPATLEARAEMQKEIDQLRTIRRNLDDAAKQR